MGTIGLDLSFLEGIKLSDSTAKAIRFNDDEVYMLKFAIYKGMKFSGYVKQLIVDDIIKHCNKENASGNISKGAVKEMILEALIENNYIKKESNEKGDKGKHEDEAMTALEELGISKRIS